MFAIGWRDKNIKTFISTHGTSLPGKAHLKKRSRWVSEVMTESYSWECPRPCVVVDYFDAAAIIDIHNHYRQAGLGLEMAWKTHDWEKSTFSTLLGFAEVDAFLAYMHERPQDKAGDAHAAFTQKLVWALINNPLIAASAPRVSRAQARAAEEKKQDCLLAPLSSSLYFQQKLSQDVVKTNAKTQERVITARRKKKSAKLNCSVCKKPAYFFCTTCSTDCRDSERKRADLVVICGARSNQGLACYNTHVRQQLREDPSSEEDFE